MALQETIELMTKIDAATVEFPTLVKELPTITIKELLLQEIESAPDTLLAEMLDFLRFMKTKQHPKKVEIQSLPTESEVAEFTPKTHTKETSTEASQLPYRPASGRSILRHAGTWAGNDFEECLQLVYATRGKARFDYENPFD